MIVVKLIGGLGNQMFQYAAGKSLAIKHRTDLYIDTKHLNKDTNDTYTKRNLELNVFDIELKIASDELINKFNIENSNKLSRYFQRHYPFLFKNLYVAESGQLYHTAFTQFQKNTYLSGYWQNEDYFKNIKSTLQQDFEPREEMSDENKFWLNKIISYESLSLHIRRGDYVTNPGANKTHGLLSLEYYKSAVEKISNHKKNIQIFIFSDDLDWCKEKLKFKHDTHYVDANLLKNAYLDMYLMKHCKHNIIANSSFSWWAAWLNNNENKMVIAPKQWFADTTIHTIDIIPKSWIQM